MRPIAAAILVHLLMSSVAFAADGAIAASVPRYAEALARAAQTAAQNRMVTPVRCHHAVRKGALIGLAVGVGTGIVMGNLLCDGAHCYMSGYVQLAGLFGLIGGTIGAGIGAVGSHDCESDAP